MAEQEPWRGAEPGRRAGAWRGLDLTLGERLALGVALVAAAVVALIGTTAAKVSAVAELRRIQVEQLLPRADLADQLETSVLYAGLAARSYALTQEERYRRRYEGLEADCEQRLEQLQGLGEGPGQARLRSVAAATQAFHEAAQELLHHSVGQMDALLAAERALEQAREALLDQVRGYAGRQRAALLASQEAVSAAIRSIYAGCLLFGLAALGVVAATALWTSRSVRRPVIHLLAAMRAVGAERAPGEEAIPGGRPPGAARDQLRSLGQELERMTRALRQREERFRALADNAPDIITRFDRQLRVLFANAALSRLTGLAAERSLGRTSRELGLPPALVALWEERLASVFATGAPVTFDCEFPQEGAVAHLEATLVPERGEDGAVQSVLAVTRDVSARVLAEEELRRGREVARAQAAQLEAILDAVGDGLIVYDCEGRTLRSTSAADALLGIPLGERRAPVQDRAERQYVHTNEVGRRLSYREVPAYRAAVCGETVRGETLHVQSRARPGGRWLRMNAVPFLVDGQRKGAVLSLGDVTDRKHYEETLREKEERLRAIFEGADLGLVELDAEDRFVATNGRFAHMLGYAPGELIGRSVHELTAPEDRAATAELYARGHRGQLRSFEHEKRYLRRDGERLWVHVTVSVVRDEAGRFLRAIGTAEDMTDRRRDQEAVRASEARLRAANEQLVEADHRKNEFLGMLSHELRNPLAPIRNSLFILDRAEPTGPQARRAREIARRQVGHLTRLVDDLLDVTRIGRGKIELRRSDLDLAVLARRTAEDHRPAMEERGLALEVQVPAEPVVVHGDETRLSQVLGNLLHNASKFTPGGGRVSLAVRRQGGRALVEVRDTGVGMDAETLRTVFEPFVQAKQTLARSEGGLGLGLALVRGLVAMHGGEASARSDGPGHGTEFTVALPLDRRRSVRPHPAGQAGEARPARCRRVLVVDDNRDAAETLAQLLELGGHEVALAHDGPSAVAAALARPPDLLLCDIGLPGMDGYEVARQLRSAGAGKTRLVALSGYAQPEDVARATEAGFDEHVAKPPDPERLERLLH